MTPDAFAAWTQSDIRIFLGAVAVFLVAVAAFVFIGTRMLGDDHE